MHHLFIFFYSKSLDENQEIPNGSTSNSIVRNLVDSIESNNTFNSAHITHHSSENSHHHVSQSADTLTTNVTKPNAAYFYTPTIASLNSAINSNGVNRNMSSNQSTDTDDAKMLSRVRSISSNQETPLQSASSYNGAQNNNNGSHIYSSSATCDMNKSNGHGVSKSIKNIISASSLSIDTANTSSNVPHQNGSNIIYSTLPLSNQSNSANLVNSVASTDALAGLVKQYGVSKRNALMKWCQERVMDYKGVEIKNFSSSWNDGLAFCALMHSFMPNRIDYELLRKENNPLKNFQTAFKLAQSLGIQQTLNIYDLLNQERPDWNAVMNYITLIYKHFSQSSNDYRLNDEMTSSNSSTLNLIKNSIINSANSNKVQPRSSSSSPTALRSLANSSVLTQNSNSIITLPLSLSASSNSTASSTSSSTSSSSIAKTIC
jgi:hypothetical protein